MTSTNWGENRFAATWGGIGAVIGYSLGTAFPLFMLVYIGKKFRKTYSKCKTLIEVVRIRFGSNGVPGKSMREVKRQSQCRNAFA